MITKPEVLAMAEQAEPMKQSEFICPLDGGQCGVGGYCDDCCADILIDTARSAK